MANGIDYFEERESIERANSVFALMKQHDLFISKEDEESLIGFL